MCAYFLSYEALSIKGGGKRARPITVSARDLEVKPNGLPEVPTAFGFTQFRSRAWLHSLADEEVSKYASFMNATKNFDRVVEGTLDFIGEVRAMSEMKLNIQERCLSAETHANMLVDKDI